jgi:hypothetical protein
MTRSRRLAIESVDQLVGQREQRRRRADSLPDFLFHVHTLIFSSLTEGIAGTAGTQTSYFIEA